VHDAEPCAEPDAQAAALRLLFARRLALGVKRRRMLWLQRVAPVIVLAALLAGCSDNHHEGGLDARYSVMITAFDPDWKIRGIKAIREETDLGLADAKRLIEETPSTVKRGLARAQADALAMRLRAQRMTVEVQPELAPPLTVLAADQSTEAVKTVVRSYYAALAKPQPGLREELKTLSPFFSAHLNKLVKQARAADDLYAKRFPTDVPPFEHGTCVFYGGGDCDFSSYEVVAATAQGAAGKATVELALIDRNRPGEPPYRWVNALILKTERGKWVIDDIEYFDTRASDALREITKEGRGRPRAHAHAS
jgi:large subunit ribosomal protein L7/L12